MNQHELPALQDIIREHSLKAQKSLGQHFILNESLLHKIAKAAGPLKGRTVVEIGPGPGGLTREILRLNPDHLYSVEKDSRFLEPLNDLQNYFKTPFTLMHRDALETNVMNLGEGPLKIVANLPYNIATPLILNWLLTQSDRLEAMALLIQKEVALRLTALPYNKNYGRLSIITQLFSKPRMLFHVPPGAFTPPPKVESSVVYFELQKPDFTPKTLQNLEKITTAAFNQRRKMLRSSLKPLGPQIFEAMETLCIDVQQRAEELSPQDYLNLAKTL